MKIGILGASSKIAGDLIDGWSRPHEDELFLYGRDKSRLAVAFAPTGAAGCVRHIRDYADFGRDKLDAVINFVGVGDPVRAAQMANSIFEVTRVYDDMAMAYVRAHEGCRYLFLSSGAVFGGDFTKPVDENSVSVFSTNRNDPQQWYGQAKFTAECVHRAHQELAVTDIRVFNYFSRTQDLASRFLMTDIVRHLLNGQTLKANPSEMTRDYLHPADFRQLVEAALLSPPANQALDCYSRAPVSKADLLSTLQERFGLAYQFDSAPAVVASTGTKANYYSRNRAAEALGYQPTRTSIDGISEEIAALIASNPSETRISQKL
ncbi:hypothetical protein BH09PSE5_BH09PSE5_51110 [soil metagenome]